MEIDLKQLRELMRSLKQFDVHEIEIEKDGERVYLRRGPDGAMAPGAVLAAPASASIPPPSPSPAEASAASIAAPAAADPNVVTITSPFVGTFYRQPSPDAAAFVDNGTEIRPGQVLCIVEAMKLMNEIESEIAGTIVEVVAVNGKPVEYGDVLFKVRKSG
ncbi:MAG: acetyl-CoA carboxylase biotin carboxyl carrier protein [Myxococcota bacterium]|nr:acetyl-CoA carboxylase biotin carboxyl carrier protein [Myxococcota bacterium]